MPVYQFALHCQRTDADRNMARFYALSIRPTLLGETAVVRCWGRIGTRGSEMTELFENEEQAVLRFLELVRLKRQRGYRPCSAYRDSSANAVS